MLAVVPEMRGMLEHLGLNTLVNTQCTGRVARALDLCFHIAKTIVNCDLIMVMQQHKNNNNILLLYMSLK